METIAQRAERDEVRGEAMLPVVHVSSGLSAALGGLTEGDLLYVSDARAWLGGLRSSHTVVGGVFEADQASISMGPSPFSVVISPGRENVAMRVRKLY